MKSIFRQLVRVQIVSPFIANGYGRKRFSPLLAVLALLLSLGGAMSGRPFVRGSQPSGAIRIVSAAYDSKGAGLAPESLAAAYSEGLDGDKLATQTIASDLRTLPTDLGGTTVTVRGHKAGLLFVSPKQVNFQIPASLEPGFATVVITAGDGAVSEGTVRIVPVSPAIFAPGGIHINGQSGSVRSDLPTQHLLESLPGIGRSEPYRVEPGEPGAEPTLTLYGTGIRGGALNRITAIIGGIEVPVDYAGPVTEHPGVDQVTVKTPDSLAGCGRVELVLSIEGIGISNSVEITVSARRGTTPPRVDSFSDNLVKVGDAIAINGTGFDAQTVQNTVRIGGKAAQVDLASATRLMVRIPYGVDGGEVSVKTSRGEAAVRPRRPNSIKVRTSLSGLVEDTDGKPVRGLRVELANTNISPTLTNDTGVFIFSNLAQGDYNVKFNSEASLLPYPNFTASKIFVESNKDKHYRKTDLQRVSGQSYQVSGITATSLVSDVESEPLVKLEEQGLVFEFPRSTTITFPGGATSGKLTLSRIRNSLVPAPFPPGQFSRVVAQLTSTAALLNPGGKLTFPNEDGYSAGVNVDLYRLDQTPGSPTIGTFVQNGTATVSADGQRIETGPNAIKEATIYLVSNPRPTTTLFGRVVIGSENLPVLQAQVRTRGQLALTDGNGAFLLRDVQTGVDDTLTVEAVFVRPDGRVAKARPVLIRGVAGGITVLPTPLVLETEAGNRPPVISIVSTRITVTAGESREFDFICYDPDGPLPRPVLTPVRDWMRIMDKGDGRWSIVIGAPVSEGGSTRFVRLTADDGQGEPAELDLEVKINGRPVANRFPLDLNTEQNTSLSITLGGSDPDGDTLTYLIVSNPANGSLSGSGSQLTYQPRLGWSGTDRFSFKINDGTVDSEVVTVNIVTNPNKPPILTVPASQRIDPGQAVRFRVVATDPAAGQVLTLAVKSALPAGAVFNLASGEFSWTPGTNQTGIHPITFRVIDDGTPALSDEKTVEITVVNSAPVLTAPGLQTVTVGESLRFIVMASDPDNGQTLLLTTGSLPTGSTFNAGSGQFAWTPTGSQTGNYTVSFTVTDNGSPALADTRTVAITVVNRKPLLTVPPGQELSAAQSLVFSVTASDPDSGTENGQVLSLTAAGLPTGATFNAASGQFAWTPTGSQTGSYTVSFTVADNGRPLQTDTKTVGITVVNRAPVLTVPEAQAVTGGQAVAFTVTANDPDNGTEKGQVLSLTAAGLPTGATFNAATGQFAWTPTTAQTGSYTVSFTVADDGRPLQTDTKTVTITVINRAPVLMVPGAQAVTGGQAVTFTVTASDADTGQTLSLTATGQPTGATFNAASGQFAWTPTTAQTGSYTVSFTVADDGRPLQTDTKTVGITVVNRAPVLTVPVAQSVTGGQVVAFAVTASDADTGQTLSLTATGLPTGATFNAASGQFAWTPTTAQTGSYTVSFAVNDNGTPALSDTKTVTITVVNRAPVLTVPGAQSVTGGQVVAFAVTASDADTGQTLSLAATGMPTGATFNAASGQFAWAPTTAQTGSYTVSFTVSDNGTPALSDTKTVAITVVNRAPVLTVPGAQAVTGGQVVAFNLTANDPDSGAENGQVLSLTATGLPSGATFNPTSGQFVWTPTGAQTGTYSVSFTVTDNGRPVLLDTKTVLITVVNRPPTLIVPGLQTANNGQMLGFAVNATDPDQGQILSASLISPPTGATLTQAGRDWQFRWTPTTAQIGRHTINLKTTDNGTPAASATAAVTIDVRPVFREVNFTTANVNDNGVVTRYAGTPVPLYEEDLGRGVNLEMVIIPGGNFLMGSPATEEKRLASEGPQRQISVSGFAMGRYEVTQAQWRAVMGTNPSYFTGDNLPVEQVSWDEAREFCRRLNALLGLVGSNGYRLPSEVEWEYAARAGATSPFAFGTTINADIVNYFGPAPYGNAPAGIWRDGTINTGSLGVANRWGLYDMHGNVAEWCEDDYHSSYVGAPIDARPWIDEVRAAGRIIRGGGWNDEAVYCRSALRGRGLPGNRYYALGFRLARNFPPESTLSNRTPVLTVPSGQTVAMGQALSFTVTATDIDPGQTLTLTATSLPVGASFSQNNPTTGEFRWTPAAGQSGSFTISFSVADDGMPSLSETKTVTIIVGQLNRAPVLNVPGAQTIFPGQAVSFTVTANDPDPGQTVLLTTSGLPPGATFNPVSGQFAWIPNATRTGTYTVSFTATDSGNPVLTDTRTVTVTVVNRAPVLTVPSARTVVTGQPLIFTVTVTDPDSGQTLTLTAGNRPSGATFNLGNLGNPGTGQFSWTPAPGQVGGYTVSFTVTDNGTPSLSDTRTVAISVINNPN